MQGPNPSLLFSHAFAAKQQFLYASLILHQISNQLLQETLNYPPPARDNAQGSIESGFSPSLKSVQSMLTKIRLTKCRAYRQL